MASLPPIRKLYLEDYTSQKSWIGPFLITLNTFMTSVVSALTKNLSFIENTTSDIKYITLAGVPTVNSPVSVAWTKTIAPIAVLVGSVRLTTNASFTLTTAIQVQWQMSASGSSLQIINVVGITPTQTTQYILTLVCIAG